MTGCDLVRPLAAELALGTLSGSERAVALAHLDACADCRREVEELAAAADALLLAAVEVDAPVGFEVRLLDRVRQADRPDDDVRHLSLRQRVVALAAAVAIVAGAGGALIGAAIRPGRTAQPPTGTTAAIRTAALVVPSTGSVPHQTGEVAISTGRPGWMMMDVTDLSGRFAYGWVSCLVETGTQTISVGQFKLSDGYGSWASPIRVPGSSVRSARIVAPDGALLATATF